jgi:hypothetical protein
MSLEKYTEEQLRAELEKRSQAPQEEPQHLCVGIIDVDGAESIIFCETGEKFAESIRSLQLRARFNSHRHPIVYCVKMPRILYDTISDAIKRGEYLSVAESLKSLSNFKSIGY